MPVIRSLVVRDDSSTATTFDPTMTNLLIALVALLFLGLALVASLFILRNHRKAQQLQKLGDLPFQACHPNSKFSNHRRLTITASPYGRNAHAINIYNDKEVMVEESSRPGSPTSPLPEIRITFPEEEDDAGKRKSGRVVVVHISENGGIGLEPYDDDHLPPYQKSDLGRFQSLDLDRIGGLKEKV